MSIARRDFWSMHFVDREGRLTPEASAALDDMRIGLNAFNFTDVAGASTSTLTTHTAVTLAGASDEVWPVTVRGDGSPEISVDGTRWGVDLLARAGDPLQIRLTSPSGSSATHTATVYAPGKSVSWSVRT